MYYSAKRPKPIKQYYSHRYNIKSGYLGLRQLVSSTVDKLDNKIKLFDIIIIIYLSSTNSCWVFRANGRTLFQRTHGLKIICEPDLRNVSSFKWNIRVLLPLSSFQSKWRSIIYSFFIAIFPVCYSYKNKLWYFISKLNSL